MCGFCIQNSDFWTRITSLYVSQTSPVLFVCKTAWFASELQVPLGPRPHLFFCAWKTSWLAPELLVSMGSSPHLWFCAFKTATLEPELHVSIGPRPHVWYFACKTAFLASEILVSKDSSPHLPFLDAKQRLLDEYNKSLWFPDITCCFVHAKHDD